MLIPLLLLASPAVPTPTAGATQTDPAVRISLNDDGKYIYGDKAKVSVRSSGDGYLVVLRSDARGDVRVLSPLDPDDDQHIQGGKKYEAKGRGGREAFVAEDTSGQGVVLAAWSKTPFDLSRYERSGHWDFQALGEAARGASSSGSDPEARLQSLVNGMKSDGRYEYDAATYQVTSPRMARAVWDPYPYAWNGWWGFDPWWGNPFYGFGTRVVVVPRVGGRRR